MKTELDGVQYAFDMEFWTLEMKTSKLISLDPIMNYIGTSRGANAGM
jgi:hypothetical protein